MRRAGLFLLLVLALTAGCIGGETEELGVELEPEADDVETNATADEILTSSVESADETGTYGVEAESDMLFSVPPMFDIYMPVEAEGGIDRTEGLARVDAEGTAEFEVFTMFSNQSSYETTKYGEDGTVYTRKAEDGETTTDGWVISEKDVDGMNLSLSDTVSVYEGVDAELEGSATVGGNEAYLLSLGLDPEDVGDHSERITDTYGPDEFGEDEDDPEEEIPEEDVGELDAYLWVDQETREPLRFSYHLAMEFETEPDDDALVDSETEGAAEFFADIRYSYDDRPEIVAPDGVEG